jgi:hypothetical protein
VHAQVPSFDGSGREVFPSMYQNGNLDIVLLGNGINLSKEYQNGQIISTFIWVKN